MKAGKIISVFILLVCFFSKNKLFAQCTVDAGLDDTICQRTTIVRTAIAQFAPAQFQWFVQDMILFD